MNNDITAVVLSGGKNSRMNYKTKAFLNIEGKTFIEKILSELSNFEEVIISCNNFKLYEQFEDNYSLVSDIIENIGPMGGIYAALKYSNTEKIFVVAADMPFITKELIDNLCNINFKGDGLVICAGGKLEPLCAIYKKSIIKRIEGLIKEKNYKMMNLIESMNVSYFYISDKELLKNINTPEQYESEVLDDNAFKKAPTIINVVGCGSNSGKTTLIEGIIKELKKKNYRVSTLKHDVHGFDIDKEGKDTYKHRMAGADSVSISSKKRYAQIRELDKELGIEEAISMLPDSDFIIMEGYKYSKYRKIEVFRKDISEEIITDLSKLIAVATDDKNLVINVPKVHINDYETLVRLVEKEAEK